MSFRLSHRSSKKYLPKVKAPIRKAKLFPTGELTDRKAESTLKRVNISLNGVASTLSNDGNWCVDQERKGESRQYLLQARCNEKLTKTNEILKRTNEMLTDLAKTRTDEIDKMEKELRRLRRIVKKCSHKSCEK